jgi:hypothetical protein
MLNGGRRRWDSNQAPIAWILASRRRHKGLLQSSPQSVLRVCRICRARFAASLAVMDRWAAVACGDIIVGSVVLQKQFCRGTEPTANLVDRLFSFRSEDFPDELNLPKNVPFRQPPHLAFPDHVQNLVALNRPPRSIERSKTLAGVWSTFREPLVGFNSRRHRWFSSGA